MKILINLGVSENAVTILEEANFEVITTKVAEQQLENFINEETIDAILIPNSIEIQQEFIDTCPSLKLIGTSGVNLDNIDVQYAKDQGVHVINASESSANAIAELVFGHLLGMVRNLHLSNREMPLEGDSNFNGLKKMYWGTELRGKTLGIIGMEQTAIATARIALGLGMKVVMYHFEAKEVNVELEFFDGQTTSFNFSSVSMEELLKDADFISVNMPSADDHILTAAHFEKMNDGIGIVNCTNGRLIDEVALIKAINDGKIKYAALDVFESEPRPEIQLLMNPNLSLSPNIASLTEETVNKVGLELANQAVALLS